MKFLATVKANCYSFCRISPESYLATNLRNKLICLAILHSGFSKGIRPKSRQEILEHYVNCTAITDYDGKIGCASQQCPKRRNS